MAWGSATWRSSLIQRDMPLRGKVNGDALHASTLKGQGDVDNLAAEAIKLSDGIAGGGEEAEWLHGGPGSPPPGQQTTRSIGVIIVGRDGPPSEVAHGV